MSQGYEQDVQFLIFLISKALYVFHCFFLGHLLMSPYSYVLKVVILMNGSFPSSVQTALAFLYVEKNAKEGMAPSELYLMYKNAFKEIRAEEEKQKELNSTH